MKHLDLKEKILGTRARRPDITFYGSGRIDITARIVSLLDLHPKDVIDIASDGRDYFLYVRTRSNGLVTGRYEGQCYQSNGKGRNFRAYSKKLCNAMTAIAGGTPARLMAGDYDEYDSIGKAVIILPQINLDR